MIDVDALAGVRVGVMQSSANLAGGPDARRLSDVPVSIRSGVDLVIDGGRAAGPGVERDRPAAVRGRTLRR